MEKSQFGNNNFESFFSFQNTSDGVKRQMKPTIAYNLLNMDGLINMIGKEN